MIGFFCVAAFYVAVLLLYKPAPDSLKATPITLAQHAYSIKVSLLAGLLLLAIFLLISNFGFRVADEHLLERFALNNALDKASLWPLQSLTHLVIHSNLVHVVANVSALGLVSAYERRVGSKRFGAVLVVASLVSIPSVIFYPAGMAVCGTSGGVFGLAAAYFTDHERLTTKEWMYAILMFVAIAVALSIQGAFESSPEGELELQVDHVGHALGAIGAIVYCRLRPRTWLGPVAGERFS